MRCIYCFETKTPADCNREHVIPEAFGRFRDSIVLHQLVCTDCNSYFGATLDHHLARRSPEGLERYGWGIKSASEAAKFQYGDTLIEVELGDEGWSGALVRRVPGPELGETFIELLPQVAFPRLDGNGMKSFDETQVRRGDWRADPSIAAFDAKEIRILAPDDDSYARLRQSLADQGISFREEREVGLPRLQPCEEVTVHQRFVLSPTMKRALAKIAFNYLASVDPASALLAGFDPVRRYIRWGTEPAVPIVHLVRYTRLGIVDGEGRVPVGHYVTREKALQDRAVLAHLSLFQWATYLVVLAHEVPRTLQGVPSGRFFNLKDMTAYQIGPGSPPDHTLRGPDDHE